MSKGEFELIDWIRSRCKPDAQRFPISIGDDMAAVNVQGESQFLISTDTILQSVHFDPDTAALAQVGYKALAVNLSDAGAMASLPVAAVAAVTLNNRMTLEAAKELVLGMEPLIRDFDCPLIGGDVVSWEHPLSMTVTVWSRPAGIEPVRRSGAGPDQALCVTGLLGGAGKGLQDRPPKHLTFRPRVRLARQLASRFHLTAMIDISDGLVADLNHICRLSGCGAEIETERLGAVIRPELLLAPWRDHRTPLEHALYDGEDFELLFTCSPTDAEAIESAELAHRIGTTRTSRGLTLRNHEGKSIPLPPGGYQHFKD